MSRERLLNLRHQSIDSLTQFTKLKSKIKQVTGVNPVPVVSFNLYQTPTQIAEIMARIALYHIGDNPEWNILEPSAGLGRIVEAVNAFMPKSRITAVEENSDCVKHLRQNFPSLKELRHGDFLQQNFNKKFDAIVMNPPFKMGRDIKHIQHALKFLCPGGVLVSLCYNGVKQNEILKPLCDTWEVLPYGTFKTSGTMADVVLLTIRGK